MLTEHQILNARDWLKDCSGSYLDIQEPSDVDNFTDDEIVNGLINEFGSIEEAIKNLDLDYPN
ncbi:hypothetical protein VF14_08770 [Nostoc linckia z18]|uniref:Uncharacterized protein n=2 Tax=Nostoc linckia TaxID=92942 RepID=A0A9Q6EM74_NOSLI|nr:hypothetical protein [Nostoc linckia]PHK42540.1 hypothetical protein VF12_02415 [Nostoc linckia z15]PHK44514.1 hypothetical protein VF13_21115 [Nostoc linckia z16]PHJ59560.1 hypothetical protein VF02_24395 [Nostoc linckia z1]PHJ65163.1 hypothetical protein VF05_21755 [Nostoc linckia z3]PHJ69563.1 hypothetical protein VF03_23475 [Nostoc linckia z2]